MSYWKQNNWLEESKACDKQRLISWACPISCAANSTEFTERRSRGVHVDCTRVSQMKPLIFFFFIFYHGRYGVLTHDSYPDVLLFHSLFRGDFPSLWLQLLQCPLVSLLGVPDRVQESLLQN